MRALKHHQAEIEKYEQALAQLESSEEGQALQAPINDGIDSYEALNKM